MNGFLNPESILKQLKLRKSMTAADFGSGSGGWVLPLSRILEEGKVYAIDILEEPLSALKSKLQLERNLNVETIKSNVEKPLGSRLRQNSCDLVLMVNLLFQCKDKKAVFEEAKRVLKDEGQILVVDWKEDAVLGPKEGRISVDEVKKIAKELKLKLANEFKAGSYHYALIFVKYI